MSRSFVFFVALVVLKALSQSSTATGVESLETTFFDALEHPAIEY